MSIHPEGDWLVKNMGNKDAISCTFARAHTQEEAQAKADNLNQTQKRFKFKVVLSKKAAIAKATGGANG